MKPAPTLIDSLYRATFRNDPFMFLRSNAELRDKLINARRFILDEAMSSFLGELATRAFVFKGATHSKDMTPRMHVLQRQRVEALRVSSMAPHRITWIEYNLRKTHARANEIVGRYTPPHEQPEIEGWLIERHLQYENAFSVHLFSRNPKEGEEDAKGYDTWAFPVMYCWTIDNSAPPWPTIVADAGTVATAISGYKTPCVTIAKSDMMSRKTQDIDREAIHDLIKEWIGVIRRMWALLATINDIPVVRSAVQANKGFVAKGRYRHYLDHTTITINIPQKQQTRLAAQVIAEAVKRRAHTVRGHWRADWRRPPSRMCPAFLATGQHSWTDEQRCSTCGGYRIRIHEHQRGDASLGFVTHDYAVQHKEI